MEIILYTNHCPRCNVLKKKLEQKNIKYSEVTSVDDMLSLGIKTVPILSLNGELMDFTKAIQWINQLEE